MTKNAYLIYWCNEGLESVVPVSQYEEIDVANTFRILADEDPVRNPVNTIIQGMLLRARCNTQRHYELYAIEADPGISGRDIESMFRTNPQSSADTIRRIGVKLWSDRINTDRIVIT
jgi:hypothetical protein